MASTPSDSLPNLTLNLLGERSTDEGLENLWVKIDQLQKQIQAERAISVKEKLDMNQKKLEGHVNKLTSEASAKDGSAKMLSSRIANPLSKYSGFIQLPGDKDYIISHEVVSSTTIKLPHSDKLPPYTTWIFLDRNQRMAEDQSVVGRRQIYYDEDGSEALICSDSEDEITEPEKEKYDFSESEDRILWMAFQEYGLGEEVVDILSQFIGGTRSEMQDRCSTLKEKYKEKRDQNLKVSGESGFDRGTLLNKTLSAALDSFDNLFCRRCMIFDCRLHGCSQSLINPNEKHSNWFEHEEDRKPCSDHCYLQLRSVSDLPSGTNSSAPHIIQSITLERKGRKSTSANTEEQRITDDANILQEEMCTSKNITPVPSEAISTSEVASRSLHLDAPVTSTPQNESMGKRKITADTDTAIHSTETVFDDSLGASKKPKVVLHPVTTASEVISVTDHLTSAKGSTTEPVFKQLTSSKKGQLEEMFSSSGWKPIEKELYLKGIEIFGRNSCLIARNMLSGLKTCIEISRYMHQNGALTTHRSAMASSSLLDDNWKADMDTEQEMPTRSRVFRRKGRTRKLKYSWKSTGHPSIWKRIADGKNRSCKQYTPCGCQSVCGKECPCQHNGTCCEKYCGCSKSCKNRFRGCHCAKSQCRSRQCPCFAAGRECDPDVCRNCWVSCGDGSLGEPPRHGEGQCGNMRLLLRQQQRILLGKSDVAGWGAFLKNPVNKNDYLGEYTGELISQREADKRGKIYDRVNSSFLFDLNDQYVLDAYRKGDKLKFANHSSNPNCYAKVMLVAGDHRVGIFAKEHIEASEELFYDYRYGPDQAPIWARKPEGSKRDDSSISQGRAKKHQSH